MKLLDQSARTNWKFIAIVAFVAALLAGSILMLIPQLEELTLPLPQQSNSQIDTSSPTPSEVEGWQTYRNDEFEFEVKYPAALPDQTEVRVDSNGISFWFPKTGSPTFANYEFFARKEDSCKPSTASVENTQLAGVPFTKGIHMLSDVIEKPDEDGTVGIQYLTDREGICYQLNYWERIQRGIRFSPYKISEMEQFIEQFYQILSTFRFVDQIDTSTWQTYRNEEFGFEFRYPKGWLQFQSDKYVGISPCTVQQDVLDNYFRCGLLTFAKSVKSKDSSDLTEGFNVVEERNIGQFKLVKMGKEASVAQYYLLNDAQQGKTIELTNREGLIEQVLFDQILSTFRFVE